MLHSLKQSSCSLHAELHSIPHSSHPFGEHRILTKLLFQGSKFPKGLHTVHHRPRSCFNQLTGRTGQGSIGATEGCLLLQVWSMRTRSLQQRTGADRVLLLGSLRISISTHCSLGAPFKGAFVGERAILGDCVSLRLFKPNKLKKKKPFVCSALFTELCTVA